MRVAWTAPALRDLDNIQDTIARDSPSSAFHVVNDIIDRTNKLLADNPRIGRRGRVAGTHEFVLTRTSYIVAYRVREQVEVLAVMHGARDWPREFAG